MLSKLVCGPVRTLVGGLGASALVRPLPMQPRIYPQSPKHVPIRNKTVYLPPTQYDPKPEHYRMFAIPALLREHWEVAPMFVVVAFGMALMLFHILWALRNKVDVVFDGQYYTASISRTMDVCNPSIHKMFTIHQQYLPWPEMAHVQRRMADAERHESFRKTPCWKPIEK